MSACVEAAPHKALLVAYCAMSATNLKAVDQVVKIVREFDRCHGFFPAARRRAEPGLNPPAEGTTDYAGSLTFCARFATERIEEIGFDGQDEVPLGPPQQGQGEGLGRLADDDERPQFPPQAIEKIDSAPGQIAPSPATQIPLAPLQRGEGWGEGLGGLAAAASRPAPPPALDPGAVLLPVNVPAADNRPEIPPQALEKIDSAPGQIAPSPAAQIPLAPLQRGEGWGEGLGGLAAAASRPAPPPGLDPGAVLLPVNVPAADNRPEIPPQALEKIQFRARTKCAEPGGADPPRPASARFSGEREGLGGLAAAASRPRRRGEGTPRRLGGRRPTGNSPASA